VRAALARALARYGPCDAGACGYALLARPAALCPGCPVPAGGAAVLWTARAGPGGGEVQVAAWEEGELAAGRPALARLDGRSACWGRAECAVALAVADAGAREVSRQASVVLLAADPSGGAPPWPLPPDPT
jgi:hypothetical protein